MSSTDFAALIGAAPQLTVGPTPPVGQLVTELLKTPPGVETTVESLHLVVHQLTALAPSALLLEWVDPTGLVILDQLTFVDPTA